MSLITLHTLLERSDPETTPTLDPFSTLLDLLLMQLLSDLVFLFLFDFHCHHQTEPKRKKKLSTASVFFS